MPVSDLLVIGAGPAGIAAAVAAARQDIRVTLVDRGSFPRPKVCGGCLNARGLSVLDRLGLSETLGDATDTHQFELAWSGRRMTAALPPGRAISRLAWDERMVAAARTAGVDVQTETTACVGDATAGGSRTVELTTAAGTVVHTTRLVAAADGLTQSATRSVPALKTAISGGSRIGAGALLDDASDDWPCGTIAMATADTGYVGLVRVEHDRLNVAAAIDRDAVRGRSLAEATAAILRDAGLPIPAAWHDATWTGTPPLTRSAMSTAALGVGCLGDAAGYVEPFTGEGMTWALAAGEAFGNATPDYLADPDRLATHWPAAFRRVVSERQRVCQSLAWILKRPRLSRVVLPIARPLVGPATRWMNRSV